MKKAQLYISISLFVTFMAYISVVIFMLPELKHNVIGNDISYPQCGRAYPEGQAFGVVGVNGGTAIKTNPCLADQLAWAANSSGEGVGQPKVQLYVNTGNPGDVADAPSWPTNGIDPLGKITSNPHGTCSGENSTACAWQYGWNRSVEAVHQRFTPAAREAGISDDPRRYTWWLDVETVNSWQYGSPEALVRNTAVLEAMTAYYQNLELRVGIYSTSYQFGKIVGSPSQGSKLNGLDSWLAGGQTVEISKSKCADPPLTPNGRVVMVQYILNNFDYNYSCL